MSLRAAAKDAEQPTGPPAPFDAHHKVATSLFHTPAGTGGQKLCVRAYMRTFGRIVCRQGEKHKRRVWLLQQRSTMLQPAMPNICMLYSIGCELVGCLRRCPGGILHLRDHSVSHPSNGPKQTLEPPATGQYLSIITATAREYRKERLQRQHVGDCDVLSRCHSRALCSVTSAPKEKVRSSVPSAVGPVLHLAPPCALTCSRAPASDVRAHGCWSSYL
jgi:hypothetical protein